MGSDRDEDEIHSRLRRIYDAIGVVEEPHPGDDEATIIQSEKGTLVYQDFRAGKSDAELEKIAVWLLYNIAHLHDHLKQWATASGVGKARVDAVVDACDDLKIIKDLANRDKHGGRYRDGGFSKRSPQLVEINRVMRLEAPPGTASIMQMGPDGKVIFSGERLHKAVVTGEVLDGDGKPIGDFYEIARKASKAWEAFAIDCGLIPASHGNGPAATTH